MRSIITVASLALLGTLVGCDAPLDGMDSGPVQVADDSGFDAQGSSSTDAADDHAPDHDAPDRHSPEGSLMGHLIWPATGPIGGASICVEGAEHCGAVYDDGGFAVHGLHPGVSETVIIRAEGFVPLVVPLEVRGEEHHWMELEMVREDPDSRPNHNGSIRFRTMRMDGYSQTVSADVNWYAFADDGSRVGAAQGAGAQLDDLRQGTYDVRYVSQSPLMCARASGWDGADANAMTVPVLAGAITHIEQACIALSLH